MYQNRTNRAYGFLLIQLLFFVVLSACSKAPQGVHMQTKTGQNDMTPQSSAPANQQAASLNANYNIATISLPRATSAGIAIDVELSTPSNEFIPFSTVHENSSTDTSGIYNDTQRGLQVRVDARCSNTSDCSKYLLLVTVFKSNQMVYQTFAISYKDDCKFNMASASFNVGSFFQSLNAAENSFNNIKPAYDIATCSI